MSKQQQIEVVRLKPYQYIHVHNNNTNVTSVVLGPTTFTKQDHEQIVGPPQQCIVVPPRHYCIIENPVQRTADGEIATDKHGQPRVRLGDKEIRFAQQPFPLYPQEKLEGDTIYPLKVLPVGKALRLRALRPFEDRQAGDEWLFEGPGTYIPRVEVEEVSTVVSRIVKPNTGLLLRARNACTDRTGNQRKAGEEWLYLQPGAYLPGVDEEVVSVVEATVLTDQKALHLECLRNFRDNFGKDRKAGELWLVDSTMTETYIAGPSERIIGQVPLTTLTDRQFCVVVDPWRKDEQGEWKQNLGQKEVRPGRTSFFLRPGETLENGIQDVFVLGEEEALLLTAVEAHVDIKGHEHKAGDRWMIYGPLDYIPTNAVKILERRHNIPLGENEGVYVRDTKTGQVRAVIGKTYMLAPDEELWEKDIPPAVLALLERQSGDYHAFKDARQAGGRRDATRVVTYSVPHNSVVQVYDYKTKRSRLVFGPDMVMLSPDEQFTVMTLSGDKPKRAGVISSLSIFLGPDFMTDIITVETSDHARLSLQLAYNWNFDVKIGDEVAGAKVFNVPDFVGDACNAIASRIRGAVAGEAFDMFHKNATNIIRAAVFGYDKQTKQIRESLVFPNNLLIITSVDIQSVEPVDTKTREALMKSVQLAIEITTKSQEAAARHEAERREQEAKGKLERQILEDKAEAEKSRFVLLQLQGESAAIESTGASKAEAKAHAAAAWIEGDAQVKQAQLKAEAQRIAVEAELHAQQKKNDAELVFKEELNKMEVERSRELAQIEVNKFKSSVGAIGKQTIAAMARAGPEMQVRLLKGLGLQGYFLTDGHSPINLMNAAQSLTGFGNQ